MPGCANLIKISQKFACRCARPDTQCADVTQTRHTADQKRKSVQVHNQPTLRPLYLSWRALWIMSARDDICRSPNISLRSENTRSAAAELGVKEPTICMASAHVGNSLPWFCQKRRTSLVKFRGNEEKFRGNLSEGKEICLCKICLYSDKNPYLGQVWLE